MPVTRRLLTLALIPLLLFLVACGGDDDDDGDAGGDQPSASDSGGSGDSGDSDSSDGDGDGDSDANVDDAEAILENCPELIASFGTIAAIGGGGDPSADFDINDAVEAFQNAADQAPDEIKADMQIMADAFADFSAAIEEVGVDLNDPASFATLDAEQQAQLLEALESFDNPELTEASANLSAYFTEHCS
jgi:hypothetical protein